MAALGFVQHHPAPEAGAEVHRTLKGNNSLEASHSYPGSISIGGKKLGGCAARDVMYRRPRKSVGSLSSEDLRLDCHVPLCEGTYEAC